MNPVPRAEHKCQRNVGKCGSRQQGDDKRSRVSSQPANGSPQHVGRYPAELEEPRGDEIENQQHPQEPGRPRRPERQCPPVLPIGRQTGIDGRHPVDRVMCQWHQQADRQRKGYADSQNAIAQEYAAPASRQARPYKKPGEKEQKRYEVDVLEAAEDVESEPAFRINDRDAPPSVGRIVEFERGSWRRAQIGHDRMHRHHDDNDRDP